MDDIMSKKIDIKATIENTKKADKEVVAKLEWKTEAGEKVQLERYSQYAEYNYIFASFCRLWVSLLGD